MNLTKLTLPLLNKSFSVKHFITIALTLICFNAQVFSQATPIIQWQKTLGGSSSDEAHSIQQTTDGGYIVVGIAYSNDGDVTNNHGSHDYWVVKLDANGNRIWQKTLGGSSIEDAWSIQQTTDGGYIVAGYTESNDGDVTGNHGGADSWIIKLDDNGNKIWQKTLGGSSADGAQSIQQTTDGGYIVAGSTASNDGDVTGNHGDYDAWIVKLDPNGNKLWQKTLGGSSADGAQSIQQTTDGGYIVAGDTYSNDGDVTGNHGGYDYWVVKLDANGNRIWQKTLGGTRGEQAYSIKQTKDGGYIVAGLTYSNDGDVTGNNGSSSFSDYWIVKLDANGNKLWQKTLGGSSSEIAYSIQQTSDGGYVVAGGTGSNDGDVTGNHGSDYWIVKLTAPCTPVTPSVSIAASPSTSVCTGTKVTFTAAVTNGGTTPVYQWKKNGINIGANSKTYIDSTLKNNDSIYCILTSDVTCATDSTAKSNVIEMTVNNPVTPTITIAASPGTSIFTGNKVTFTATVTNGGASPIYQWKKNGTNVGTNSKTYLDSALKTGDSIYCTLTVNAPCTITGIVNSSGIKITVNSSVNPPCIQWQKTFGGTSSDEAHSIQQTNDGGYITAGGTSSNDGDVTGHHGDTDNYYLSIDFWIVKFNANGNIIWQKSFGGYSYDDATGIQQTADGGYIVSGVTSSNDGDVTGNHGGKDFWVLKLDTYGNMLWEKTFGGTSDDEARSIQQTTDGGYIVAGTTLSNDGDVTGYHSGTGEYPYDSWIVKLDANGNITWQKAFGGSGSDYASSIQQTTDGGYIVAGTTTSTDGDVIGNHGGLNFWILKLNTYGNMLWQKTFGGTSYDDANSIQQTKDGGFIVAGSTMSNDGDVTDHHEGYDFDTEDDFWIVKLDADGDMTWQKTLGGFSSDFANSIQQTIDGGYIVAGTTSSNDGM